MDFCFPLIIPIRQVKFILKRICFRRKDANNKIPTKSFIEHLFLISILLILQPLVAVSFNQGHFLSYPLFARISYCRRIYFI